MYNKDMSTSTPDSTLYNELAFDTLSRTDPFFLHQILVDAYAAQHATTDTKPIGVAFALMGLCLFLEHGYTGKEVQNAHILLAKQSKQWPQFAPPENPGRMTIADVVAVPKGDARDAALKEWARAVWDAWEKDHERVHALLHAFLEI